ncbi:MAG TPA: DUF3300 domain-containing protein [Opitutaceae bacterium]|nr:DUF3300 domain-containing protein [Opitutaceae bacterium]
MALRKALPALLLVEALLLNPAPAQTYPAETAPLPQPPPAPAPYAGNPAAQPAPQEALPAPRPPSAIDQLVGPVALYPDPLLALILPASTVPADVAAASAYLVQYGDMTRIDSQPWDPSVRALAHYPAIVSWMAENIEWTRALGSAFLSSPAEVMESVQRLRAKAMAAGSLASTPRQQVVLEDGAIEILPAERDSIYAPAYDTDVVYSDEPFYGFGGPFMNFGAALEVGPWLSFCLDWRGHSVWTGAWSAWHGHGWHHPHFGGDRGPPGSRRWIPPSRDPGSQAPERGRDGTVVALPHPLIGAPNPPPHFRRPEAQVSPQPASPVPVPRSTAPPMDRPRLGQAVEPDRGKSHSTEAVPGYASTEVAPRAQSDVPAPAIAPAADRAQSTAPVAGSEPARASAPAASHQSAPAPAHASAPAPAPAADSRNR